MMLAAYYSRRPLPEHNLLLASFPGVCILSKRALHFKQLGQLVTLQFLCLCKAWGGLETS